MPGVAAGALAQSTPTTSPGAAMPPLKGGALATFEVCGEHHCDRFRVWTTNPQTVAQLKALKNGTSHANIPIGPLAKGPGPAAYNKPWSWHFDPAKVSMTEVAIEACDGEPSYVEVHLADFLHLGSYCPWAAKLVALAVIP
jgi:hypothetical protein